MQISFEPAVLRRQDEPEARLVLIGNRFAAVLSKLTDLQGEQTGRWFLEWGVEPFAHEHPDFADLDAARDWFVAQLARR